MKDLKDIAEFSELVNRLDRVSNERRAANRIDALIDPEAPVCVSCKYCEHQGFLFHCMVGFDIGLFGMVFYKRKGHKSRTFTDTPKTEEDCNYYSPILPKAVIVNMIRARF